MLIALDECGSQVGYYSFKSPSCYINNLKQSSVSCRHDLRSLQAKILAFYDK